MSLLARLALRTGIPQRAIVGLLIVLAIVGPIIAWNVWLADHDEEIIAGHENAIEAQLQRQGRAADQNMADRAVDDLAAQAQAREEFDNATAHLLRTGLTDRQRIDACNELRAQGEAEAVLASAGCVQAGAAPQAQPGRRHQQ